MFNIYNFINTAVSNNNINLYFLNDFSLINFFSLKTIIFADNTITSSSLTNTAINIKNVFEIQNSNEITMYYSLILDYYNFANNIIYSVFNFNNTLNYDLVFNSCYLNDIYLNKLSYKLLSISFFKNSVFSYNSWFLGFVTVSIVYLLFIIYYLLFTNKINAIYKNEKLYDEYNSVINYLVESEKELGSLDDMLLGVSILICIYGWFFFGTVFLNFLTNSNINYIYCGFPLFLFIVLGMPTNMVWNYGIFYSTYLRGSSNTTLFFLEFMYDILATTIMYIRLFVQNVRFILMFFAFFECYEFFNNVIFITKNYYSVNSNFSVFHNFYNFFITTTNFFIFYLYNIGHLMYTIISHFFAYLILVFWFFSFLYTTFLQEKLELFFCKKR